MRGEIYVSRNLLARTHLLLYRFKYIKLLLVCTHISSVCHSYVLVCIRMSLVCTRMSLIYTRMSSVCHSYVLVCHPCVTRMYPYVIRLSLVCGFAMNLAKVSRKRCNLND